MSRRSTLAALLLGSALGLAACAQLTADQPDLPNYWLKQALAAVQARDAKTALADINQAESLWIGSNVPFTNTMFVFDPEAMRNMGRARQSVEMQRWDDAEYYLRTAITHPSTVTPP